MGCCCCCYGMFFLSLNLTGFGQRNSASAVTVSVCIQRSVFTLGTLPEGWNGISDEVFLSIPVCIGEKGITHLVSQKLSESELAKVQQSAKTLRSIMDDIQL